MGTTTYRCGTPTFSRFPHKREVDGARIRRKVMLLRRRVVRFCARVAAVPAVVRTLTSRITVRDAVEATAAKEDVSVLGWVKNVRKQKELVFLDLNDGSTAARLQVVAPSNLLRGTPLTVGCSVVSEGNILMREVSPATVEMAASQVRLLGPCDPKKYPFKRGTIHGLEYLRQFPHLRPQTGVYSRLLRLRSAATMAVHHFFQNRGFINVHTPIITSSDCEGAGELFEITPSRAAEKEKMFFSTNAFLTVSGQLHAEAIMSGMSSVYTFGPTFRAEKSHTKRHLSEFYMIEAETVLPDSGLPDLLCLIEDLYKHTLWTLLSENQDDISYFHDNLCSDEAKISILDSLERPFARMTYTEAMEVLEKAAASRDCFQTQPKWGQDLQREHELHLLSVTGQLPVFVTDFPAAIKPFYARTHDSDCNIVSSVDLLVPGVGEVVGGSVREEREKVLRDRLTRLGWLEKYQWYLDLRQYGTVPHGGFGLGFERLLQAFLGLSDIRDVIPFPRYLGSCQM